MQQSKRNPSGPYFRLSLQWCVAVLTISLSMAVDAATPVRVAIITDGPEYQMQDFAPTFRQELVALTAGEFEVEFLEYSGNWSRTSIEGAFNSAYADPNVDLVLVSGFAATQLGGAREAYPKPTFLPLMLNAELVVMPRVGNSSGTKNLNYLTDTVAFAEDLETFRRLLSFDEATVVADASVIEAIGDTDAVQQRIGAGVDFSFVVHDGSDHDLGARIPADVEVILLGGLARMPEDELTRFLDEVADRGIAAFSLTGLKEVKLGALASDTVDLDLVRLARKTALNVQAVLLGGKASEQEVGIEGKRELTINMQTARKIGLSPRFDVLSEAVLINAEPPAKGVRVDLRGVADMVLAQNLEVAAGRIEVEIGEADVVRARSGLLPQLGVAAALNQRDSSSPFRSIGSAENSTDGALTLNQMLYSERTVAGYTQQQLNQRATTAGQAALELDRISDAATAYLQTLSAEIQLQIQQDNLTLSKTNLDLARNRVRIGASTAADEFRWESSVATARTAVLAALARREQAHERLNFILNRSADERLQLAPAAKTDPFSMTEKEYNDLITNPRRSRWFAEFIVTDGLNMSPELAQIDALIAAAERDVKAKSRAFWLPDFSLEVQYSDNLNQSGIGSGPPLEGANDWGVSVNASIPLFSGGLRRAELDQAELAVRQLTLQRADIVNRIEQNVLSAYHALNTSYLSIELFEAAATAARKNLELVTDGYRQGTVNVIELLDAQNQSLQADLNANDAVNQFLLDVITLQRASGEFDFMLSAANQAALTERLRSFIESRAVEFERERQR
ncbi:MAG: TolC family protein [Pseudomonadota bacterium]